MITKRGICVLLLATILGGCAPLVRQGLTQTLSSLPPAPPGAVLLAEREGSASGSDCVAYYVDQIYGSQQSLDELLMYYDRELIRTGWRLTEGSGSDPQVPRGLTRNKDEHIAILTDKYVYFRSSATSIPPATIGQYATVYILRTTRTCGG